MMRRGVIPPPGPGQRDTIVAGVRWRSREAEGSGTPVVFVHGLLASSATWEGVLRPASAGHPAIAVDLPGFGCSDRPWPHDYTAGGEAADLAAFLDARGISRAILVGNSLGGSVAMLVAAERPDRVAALVLAAPATPETLLPWNLRFLRLPGLGELIMALSTRRSVAWGLRHRLFARASRVTDQAIDDAWFPLTVPGTRRAALAAVRTDPTRYVGMESRIRAPTLILWGREDRLLPVEEAGNLAGRIPGSHLVILPDAGHLPQREQPGPFAQAVSGFLTSLA
jgi:pimeloyl-ACP methyl ester carboxylesterase